MIDVSIVIVCMNNLNNLYPCLDSIRKYTQKVTYETIVVAYLFKKDNLDKVKNDYPWVSFVESNEIRGFSENNNLALKQARGKYCFILNDDTYFTEPVIDNLIATFNLLPEESAIVSPDIRFPDGQYQVCGRPPQTWLTYILKQLYMWKENRPSKYINKKGVFQTYNILGAAFLIKTNVFRSVGFFDEKYFFCPEDIALSTKINRMGYKCYVNSDIKLVHIAGGSKWSSINNALKPAGVKGSVLFFSEGSVVKYSVLSLVVFLTRFVKCVLWYIIAIKEKSIAPIQAQSNLNVCKEMFSKRKPKDIFIKYYK